MARLGADVAGLRELATSLTRRAQIISDVVRDLHQPVHEASWVGQDRDKFVHEWDTSHRRRLEDIAQTLRQGAQLLRNHADAQERIGNS